MPPIEEELDVLDTEDYSAFTSAREAGHELAPEVETKAPEASEEETSPSEPADEADQTAAESETEEDSEQAALEAEEAELEALKEDIKPAKGEPKNQGLAKRMRELTGQIAALKTQLAERETADVEEETPEEVASSPEVAAPIAEDAVEPMLKDFEDDDATGKSAWDLYRVAMKAYEKGERDKAIAAALAAQKTQIDKEHATKEAETVKQLAQADWNKAASRFPNFNEKATDKIQLSTAMQNVMRMDPMMGTELVMYFGDHPEECKEIALQTLAKNDQEFGVALARAGMLLGKIHATLKPPSKTTPPSAALKSAAAAPPTPTTKKVTTASRPPTQIRGGTATPKFDVTDEGDAGDYNKWTKAREKQLANNGRR